MLELFLQIKEDVVVLDVDLVLPPQEAYFFEICQYGCPNDVFICRTFPTDDDFI
jgi:hypothetical protein